MDISVEVKRRREAKDLSLNNLAKLAKLSKGYLWQIENQPGKAVSAQILFRIADVLGCKMEDFFNTGTHSIQFCVEVVGDPDDKRGYRYSGSLRNKNDHIITFGDRLEAEDALRELMPKVKPLFRDYPK